VSDDDESNEDEEDEEDSNGNRSGSECCDVGDGGRDVTGDGVREVWNSSVVAVSVGSSSRPK
jgi:hypothetical protein